MKYKEFKIKMRRLIQKKNGCSKRARQAKTDSDRAYWLAAAEGYDLKIEEILSDLQNVEQ